MWVGVGMGVGVGRGVELELGMCGEGIRGGVSGV